MKDNRDAKVRQWYQYRSKDRKIQGYCLVEDEAKVARFAGYPVEDLIIEKVVWNGREFVKDNC